MGDTTDELLDLAAVASEKVASKITLAPLICLVALLPLVTPDWFISRSRATPLLILLRSITLNCLLLMSAVVNMAVAARASTSVTLDVTS